MSAPPLTLPCPHLECRDALVLDRTSYADARASGTARVRYAGLAGHGHDCWIDLVPEATHAPGCYSYLNPTEAGRHRKKRTRHLVVAERRDRVLAMLASGCTQLEITHEVGCSTRTILRIKQAAGVRTRRLAKGATP